MIDNANANRRYNEAFINMNRTHQHEWFTNETRNEKRDSIVLLFLVAFLWHSNANRAMHRITNSKIDKFIES